jgi:hypothetical protein
MRGATFRITKIILVVILIGAISVAVQAGENEQLRTYYKEYISKCISINHSKASLQTSKSKNLRSCGIISKQKAIFLTDNLDMLVNELINNEIGKKPYKIDYYLTHRFYAAYQ